MIQLNDLIMPENIKIQNLVKKVRAIFQIKLTYSNKHTHAQTRFYNVTLMHGSNYSKNVPTFDKSEKIALLFICLNFFSFMIVAIINYK